MENPLGAPHKSNSKAPRDAGECRGRAPRTNGDTRGRGDVALAWQARWFVRGCRARAVIYAELREMKDPSTLEEHVRQHTTPRELARFAGAALILVLGAAAPARAAASGRTLVAEPVQGEKIRIDGDLREWPLRMTKLGEVRRGSALEARTVIGYDDTNIYLALRVADKRVARTKAAGEQEDHATLHLAFPKGHGYVTYSIDIYPGQPGKLPALVRVNGKTVKGAKAVENPALGELLLEALVPWSAFPESNRTRVGLRAAVSYANADTPGSIKTIVSTSNERQGRGLGALFLEGEQGLGTLLRDNGLSDLPAREAYGDLSGDGMLERAALFGRFFTITGPNFRGGKEFYYADLGVTGADMVKRLSLADLDGDGHEEAVLEKRVGDAGKYRGVLEVFKIGRGDSPYSAFSHEIAIKTEAGSIENKVTLSGKEIVIEQGESEGFEPDTYAEPLPNHMPSALLPWDSIGSRRYAWQGGKFVQVGEQRAEPKVGSKKPGASQPRAAEDLPPPRPPSADELLDRVYALYKRDRGVTTTKPRFDFATDVAGDEGRERVLIHDKDIVVFGKGFRSGTSYAFISVGVSDPQDILEASARDVTGDGKAEIILRAVMRAKASKALGGDTVDRHAFLVYGVRGDKLVRLFGAETARSLGKKSIQGTLAFEPSKRGVAIALRPGRAIGWTEATYPFPADTASAGGLEPLLLPWTSDERRYRFDGTAFVLVE